ncbi:hypothetical protein [Dactylosporangium sp. NPDC005555]|uniref:hypothetical protein n=1 Tax=Dactylosporangium sp. NPDC005555 TaxID=3154889 RepID=UPI0033B89AC3
MDWDEVLWHTERRLGMYVGLPRYDRAYSLLTGFDLAHGLGDLGRFQAWMAERHGGSPVAWPWLILRETFDDGDGERSPVTDEAHQIAIKNLCLRLREFLDLPADDSR